MISNFIVVPISLLVQEGQLADKLSYLVLLF